MAPGQEWSWPPFWCWSQGTEPALGALVSMHPPKPLRELAGAVQHLWLPQALGCTCCTAESYWEVPKTDSAVLSSPWEMPEKLRPPARDTPPFGSFIHEEQVPEVCLEPRAPSPAEHAVSRRSLRCQGLCTCCTKP